MKTNYIEQMSVADRNNSLTGYFHSLIKKYNTYYREEELGPDEAFENQDDICCQVINSGYLSFAAVLQREKDLGDAPAEPSKKNTYTSEEYAALKFALSKHLNLIEKIIYKLCYGSIDSSITEENAEIESIKQAMTWLFVDCVNSKQPSYQDVERVKMILNKKSIIERIKSITEGDQLLSGKQISDMAIDNLNNHVANNHTQRTPEDIRAFVAYKCVIRKAIHDMFRVLSNLLNFSQYLAVVEETVSPHMMHMMANNTFETLEALKTKPNMEKILALAEGVKTLLIEYFSSFVKIKRVSLPHSFLADAEFSHSTITGGNFTSSDITGANLSYASARDCDFSMCAMNNIYAPHADFTGCTFNYSGLIGANLSNAILNDTALNSITLLDNRILQRNLYTCFPTKTGSQISFFRAAPDIKVNFESYLKPPQDAPHDLRGNVISRLGRHYTGNAGSLAALLETPRDDSGFNCPYIIKNENECVLDGIHAEVVKELQQYRLWCATQFLHPACLAWASNAENTTNAIRPNAANLDSASIKNSTMPDCAFSIIRLQNASFQNTDLNNSTYYYTNAQNAFFGDCNMAQSQAGYSDFRNATFSNTNLIGAQFLNCRLSETNFGRALLIDAVIMDTAGELFYKKKIGDKEFAELNDESGTKFISIEEGDLAAKETIHNGNAVIASADMQDSNFSHCIANNIAIVGINMDRSIFTEANMKRAFLYNCLSRWTDYEAANLSYALVIGTTFGHSALSDANLTSARIFACDFSDCDMRNVNLINARIDNTIFSNCDLERTNFSNAIFVNCMFKNLNMHFVNFTNCVFINCIFDSLSFSTEHQPKTLFTCKNLFTSTIKHSRFIDKNTYDQFKSVSKEYLGSDTAIFENCVNPN